MLDFISSNFQQFLTFIEGVNPVYIYLIIFGMAFLENVFPPLPGDTFTIIGGYLAASGKLSLALTLTSVTLGTMLSVMAIYGLGYHYGRGYFSRKRFWFFNAGDIRKVQGWFGRYGFWTLLFSRFVVGGRVAIAVSAGISRYPTMRMTIFSLISTILFHGVLIASAYFLHAYISELIEGFNLYSKIILVILGVLLIIWTIFLVRRIKYGKKKT